MLILDTTGQNIANKSVEFKKPLSGFIFEFNGNLVDLSTETILLKVVRTDIKNNVLIHQEAVNLKDYLMLATYMGNPIGFNENGLCVRVPLTLRGNIIPTDSDFVSFEFKNLKTLKNYIFNSTEASFSANTAMTYKKLTQPKDNTSIDFIVNGYDSALINITQDITSVETKYSNGYVKRQSLSEYQNEITQANGVLLFDTTALAVQQLHNKLLVPLVGVNVITFYKDQPSEVTTMLVRDNIIQ